MRNLTLEQYQSYWYRKYLEVFGKHEADQWLKDNISHHTKMKQLWMAKGFKTVGEYEDWERDHIEERNEFFGRHK